jgi:hypothetical protein
MRALLLAAAAFFMLAVPASAVSPDLVVSQVYGGGSNTGATHTHDFIEIFNRGQAAVPLGGKSLQYASATGTGNLGANAGQATDLPNVSLEPGQSFLVQESGGSVGTPLAADFTDASPINMSASAGKVAIVQGTDSLGCNGGSAVCSADQLARIIDLVGYGGANFFEGTGTAPGLTSSTAAARAGAGCQDTDDNRADFALADPPAPRNALAQRAPCAGDAAPSVAASSPQGGATDVPLDSGISVTFSEPVVAAASAFSLACGTSGAHALAVSGGPTTYTLDPDGTFVRAETCTLTVAADGVRDLDVDDPPDTMGSDARIAFTTLGLELRIREIQGTQHVSPHFDDLVSKVPGVVTARRRNGFFFQDAQPDADVRTPEGLFVFTGGAPRAEIAVGSAVLVSGRVSEFRGAANALGMTQIVQPAVAVTGDGADIAPTAIGAGGRVPPGRVIDNDSLGDVDLGSLFDPEEDGIDFYETLEGMLVRVADPYVVDATASFGEIPVVADGGRFAGPFTARGGLIIEPGDFNPERMHFDDEVLRAQSQRMPEADVRDRLTEVDAVVDYSFGNFKLQVTSPPEVIDGGLEKEVTEPPGPHELSVGSFNVENLRPSDSAAKFQALARTVVERMQAPDIVGVEEIQDNNGTTGGTDDPVTDASQTWQALIEAIKEADGPTYDYRQIDPVAHQDGGQPGGNIRVGFLFRTDRGLEFVDRPGGTSTNATGVVDTRQGPQLTFSPGRIQPADPAWTASRKPLAGEFRWRGRTVIAVVNHFASKGGDDPLFGRFQPPVRHTENGPDGRHRQATLVNEFVRDVLAADGQARVIVLGDINDFEFSETVDILESGGVLTSLFDLLPKKERYSYVFEGNSQVLDQILVSDSLMSPRPEYDSVHMNAEFADQTSDHDPQVARLDVTGRNDAAHAFGDR